MAAGLPSGARPTVRRISGASRNRTCCGRCTSHPRTTSSARSSFSRRCGERCRRGRSSSSCPTSCTCPRSWRGR
jgi:hypothetical protein